MCVLARTFGRDATRVHAASCRYDVGLCVGVWQKMYQWSTSGSAGWGKQRAHPSVVRPTGTMPCAVEPHKVTLAGAEVLCCVARGCCCCFVERSLLGGGHTSQGKSKGAQGRCRQKERNDEETSKNQNKSEEEQETKPRDTNRMVMPPRGPMVRTRKIARERKSGRGSRHCRSRTRSCRRDWYREGLRTSLESTQGNGTWRHAHRRGRGVSH